MREPSLDYSGSSLRASSYNGSFEGAASAGEREQMPMCFYFNR